MICSKRFVKRFLFIAPVPRCNFLSHKTIGRCFLKEQAPWNCRAKKIVRFAREGTQ